MDEAHEQVADVGAVFGFVKERVFPVQDSHLELEGSFADFVVQRGVFDSEKERQFLPVIAQVIDRLA